MIKFPADFYWILKSTLMLGCIPNSQLKSVGIRVIADRNFLGF